MYNVLVSEYLSFKQQGLCRKKDLRYRLVLVSSKSVITITSIAVMKHNNCYITVIITVITIIELYCFIVAIIPIPLQQVRLLILIPLGLLVIFPLLTVRYAGNHGVFIAYGPILNEVSVQYQSSC